MTRGDMQLSQNHRHVNMISVTQGPCAGYLEQNKISGAIDLLGYQNEAEDLPLKFPH